MIKELEHYIKEIPKFPYRGDCPICGHRNTFSAAIIEGVILYHCFSANCSIRGRLNYEISLDDIRKSINNCSIRDSGFNSLDTPQEFVIPDYWQNPLQNKQCFNFMKRWNIIEPYIKQKLSLYYDPKEERCVFLLRDHKGRICGATGRALAFTINPRWRIYVRLSGCPFICLSEVGRQQAILVEDAISAVRCSYIYDGIAILGTNLPSDLYPHLLSYKRLFVGLDPDATSKAIKLVKQLSPYIDTKLLILKNDIKYHNKLQLEELRKEICQYQNSHF